MGAATAESGLVSPTSCFHDLRHTYAMQRAMRHITFRQLQIELGHSSPQSIQTYLDQAVRFEPQQSLFFRQH